MWPFTPKTLFDRYSKLMKLIMSIDSHFEVTENTDKTVRLHLPNYKGNQPIDFHIYLLEPFLSISFVTEIEGERISVLNSYHQSIDQQDMFNMAMSSNLERVHQVLEKKYIKEEQTEEKQTVKTSSSYGAAPQQQENGIPLEFAIEDLKETFDYNESFKKHALTFLILRPKSEFWYYSEHDDEKPLWIYNDKDEKNDLFLMEDRYVTGTFPFLWYLKKYEDKEELCWFFDFLNRHNMDLWTQEYAESTVNPDHPDELIKEMKRYVPSLNIRNNPHNIKVNLGWSWIDIQSMIRFIDYCMNNTDWTDKPNDRVNTLRECSTLCDLAYLVMKDMGYDFNRSNQKGKDSEPKIIESWSLLEFAKENGAMKVTAPMTHVNAKTGEEFLKKKCAFVHPIKKDGQGRPLVLFVDFSSHLGELSPQEISERKNELVVVKYESGRYVLDRKQNQVKTEEIVLDDPVPEVTEDDLSVSEDDIANAWIDEFGVKYSADRTRLLKAPREIENYSVIDGTKVICNNAFSLCGVLNSIFLPNSVFYVGFCTFFNCRSLTSINIPNSVVRIGDSAFSGCYSLKSIKISGINTRLGNSIFHECRSLTSIVVNEHNKFYDSRENCNAIIETKTNTLLAGCSSTIIPDSVTSIGGGAFNGNCFLTSIIIPNSITIIENWAFSGCKSLTSIFIPDSVTSIGERVFSECEALISIVVSEQNKYYDSRNNCNAIIETKSNTLLVGCGSTIIPESVTSIGGGAFNGNNALSSIIIPNSVKSIGKKAFQKCRSLTSIIIPDSVTSIGGWAFEGCAKLKSIKFPKYLNKIEDNTFYNCSSLTSIEIPHNVKSIGYHAFRGCALSTVLTQDGVIEIGEGAFSGCIHLKHVTLADSVIKIGREAFDIGNGSPSFYIHVGQKDKFAKLLPSYERWLYECEYEEDLVTEVTQKDIKTAWIDEHGIMYSANKKRLLRARKDLTSYTVGIGTVTICDSAFEDCENLHTIILPKSIKKIGEHAFKGCSSLNNILIPKSVVSISNYAFADCKSLISLTILCSAEIGEAIFDGCNKLETIYMPSESGWTDLHEYSGYVDKTKEYPFICSWSIEDFIKMYGELHIEECVNDHTGEKYIQLVFSNPFGVVKAKDYYYWGREVISESIKEKKNFRIGQDSNGDYWLYDKTLAFWLPGMSTL